MASSNITVAVRIRPRSQKEQKELCNICTYVTPGEPQILLGKDKPFTFDFAFDIGTKQSFVYDRCIRTLVDGIFDGFNATVLAYGQTGSGKTHTMGTNFDDSITDSERGVIPRAISQLFDRIRECEDEARAQNLPLPKFAINVQFIEIYNEDINDLLATKSAKPSASIRIHEDAQEGIIVTGVEHVPVETIEQTFSCLQKGSKNRTTGATLMNCGSSRSHAIFTLFITQTRVERFRIERDESEMEKSETRVAASNNNESDEKSVQHVVTVTAKFNFVDLAGSERLSRTGAVGERAREGISINSGLLHLGNVISALGDRTKRAAHIPYRDSKLTRILQDSLGGNSVTTMIACISPCDRDFVETLNTLRYANRAKNIKNKVVANQNSDAQHIAILQRQIVALEQENLQLRTQTVFPAKYPLNAQLIERLDRITRLYLDSIRGDANYAQISSRITQENDYLKSSMKLMTGNDTFDISYNTSATENELENDDLDADRDGEDDDENYDPNEEEELDDENDNDDEVEMIDDDDDRNRRINEELSSKNVQFRDLLQTIDSKQKLIAEAEAKQSRLIELTNEYEAKILSCRQQIEQTESERDSLKQRLERAISGDEKRRLKAEYDRKIDQYQRELRKFDQLKREHQRYVRNDAANKTKMSQMRAEILEAKRQRVKIIGQMRDQTTKHSKEMQHNRQLINRLSRQEQRQVAALRDLQHQSDMQRKILRHRTDEIRALRRQIRSQTNTPFCGANHRIVDRISGRRQLQPQQQQQQTQGSTPKHVQTKWIKAQHLLQTYIDKKITFHNQERKLQSLLEDRKRSIGMLNTLKSVTALTSSPGAINPNDAEYLENLQTEIDYLSTKIEDTQKILVDLQEDDEAEPFDLLISVSQRPGAAAAAAAVNTKQREINYIVKKVIDQYVALSVEFEQKKCQSPPKQPDYEASQQILHSLTFDVEKQQPQDPELYYQPQDYGNITMTRGSTFSSDMADLLPPFEPNQPDL